jgi:nucleoside phosphorylase
LKRALQRRNVVAAWAAARELLQLRLEDALELTLLTDEALSAAAASDAGDYARELIEFDSEGTAGEAVAELVPHAASGLSGYVEPSWPSGLAPRPGSNPSGHSLPKADVLIVTWTMDEGHALSRVLTPGLDRRDDWKPYRKNFTAIAQHMRPGCPARNYGRLGTYWTTRIGDKKATLFKSDSHMSQDGPQLPNATVWEQVIKDCSPEWVLTTGTGGGIGKDFEVGDVIVSRYVSFDCQRQFKALNGQTFASTRKARAGKFATAKKLFAANEQFLPKDNPRRARIVASGSQQTGILTTDFFGFDNTANTYGLQGKGDLSEMGDAVLGMVCKRLGAKAPKYAGVRNVSDPEIDSKDYTIHQQAKIAADIYKVYGRWSSVCSAIVCWAIVAGL